MPINDPENLTTWNLRELFWEHLKESDYNKRFEERRYKQSKNITDPFNNTLEFPDPYPETTIGMVVQPPPPEPLTQEQVNKIAEAMDEQDEQESEDTHCDQIINMMRRYYGKQISEWREYAEHLKSEKSPHGNSENYIFVHTSGQPLSKAHVGDAAYDLRNEGESITLLSHETTMIPTRVFFYGFDGGYAYVLSRSGMAKKGIMVSNSPGLIDDGFRGEVMVLLTNVSNGSITIEAGDRVAQIQIFPDRPLVHVDEKPDPNSSDRGEGGFGSTGVK